MMEKPREESEIFTDLETLCGTAGYIHALAYISHRDNYISYENTLNVENIAKSYAPSRIMRTEFSTLMGLLLKKTIDFKKPPSELLQSLIDRTEELLHEMHQCLQYPIMRRMLNATNEISTNIDNIPNVFSYADVMREPIFYGSESAYNFQFRDFAKVRYFKDNQWLNDNKGFKIEDCCNIAKIIPDLAVAKFNTFQKNLLNIHPETWTILPIFTFSIEEVMHGTGISFNRVKAVLDAFTSEKGPINWDFLSINDFNLANAYPLIKTPTGDYICLQSYNFAETIYDSPFYWMANDTNYKDTASKNRGAFTEEITYDRLAEVFGEKNVHVNVNIYKSGNIIAEADVLVTFGNRILVLQCKSKKLTLEARKGNDLQLKSDFKKSIQDSYDQALSCSKFINDPKAKFINGNGEEVFFPEFREIYPICVVSDHYPALTIQAREFLHFSKSDIIHPPLVTDVFLMDVLCEMLSSPLHFLSYINRRVNYHQKLDTIDELTILSLHLTQNLWLDDEYDRIMLEPSIAIPLDTAMTVRREGIEGQSTPKGILTQFEGTFFDRLIKSIEYEKVPELIDFGFFLLTLDGNTIANLNNGVKEMTRQTRIDGLTHDFSFCFDKADSGITVHCNNLDEKEARKRLFSHCSYRKYQQRTGKWYGLSIDAHDQKPRFAICVESKWKQDNQLDMMTRNMKQGSRVKIKQGSFKKRKIGRNEICPCGSKLKYKKCCINKVL